MCRLLGCLCHRCRRSYSVVFRTIFVDAMIVVLPAFLQDIEFCPSAHGPMTCESSTFVRNAISMCSPAPIRLDISAQSFCIALPVMVAYDLTAHHLYRPHYHLYWLMLHQFHQRMTLKSWRMILRQWLNCCYAANWFQL